MKKLIPALAASSALCCVELWRSNRTIDKELITVVRSDLPAGFDGFRVAHISDLHGESFGEANSRLVSIIAEERPDIIAITGDIADKPWEGLDVVGITVKKLAKTAPIYYVPGNHEYKRYGNNNEHRDAENLFRLLKNSGATVLRNQAVELERGGDRITLLGIDDPSGNANQITMDEAVKLAGELYHNNFTIMLNHRYDRAEKASETGVQVMLAGHAHGGLIRLPFTDGIVGPAMVIFPTHTNGLYDIDGMSLITSRGLGNAGWTRRMFNRPHIPIVELKAG